jgi:hypothetical protein
MGRLYGMELFVDENIVKKSTAFTRKQTRKFKNNRWVKKYMKKYSYEVITPSMSIININNKLVMHPEAWILLQEKLNENKTN